jgi:rhomboid-related protein 1/2/3
MQSETQKFRPNMNIAFWQNFKKQKLIFLHHFVTKTYCTLDRRREAWRFLTYAFVHSGYGHILVNAIIQLLVGLPLEMSHGSWRLGAVYTAGVLSGSLATACFDPRIYLAGASGGVYALIAAHLATLILNWEDDAVVMRKRIRKHKITKTLPGTVIRLLRLVFVVVYAVADIGHAIYLRLADGTGRITTVGYTAHFAGAAAGLLVGLPALRNRRQERWERVLQAGVGNKKPTQKNPKNPLKMFFIFYFFYY